MSTPLALTTGATDAQKVILAYLTSLNALKGLDNVLNKGKFVLDEALIQPHPDQRPLAEAFVLDLLVKVQNQHLTSHGGNEIIVVAKGPMYAGERSMHAAVASDHPMDGNGKLVEFWVLDGQHRLEALRRAEHKAIHVTVYHEDFLLMNSSLLKQFMAAKNDELIQNPLSPVDRLKLLIAVLHSLQGHKCGYQFVIEKSHKWAGLNFLQLLRGWVQEKAEGWVWNQNRTTNGYEDKEGTGSEADKNEAADNGGSKADNKDKDKDGDRDKDDHRDKDNNNEDDRDDNEENNDHNNNDNNNNDDNDNDNDDNDAYDSNGLGEDKHGTEDDEVKDDFQGPDAGDSNNRDHTGHRGQIFPDSLMESFHSFVYPIFSQLRHSDAIDLVDRDIAEPGSKFNFIIKQFYTLHALNKDSIFRLPCLLTGYFTQTKYISRVTTWYEAQRHLPQFSEDPLKYGFYALFLHSLAYSVDTYGKRLACGHCILDIDKYRNGLKELNHTIIRLICQLFNCSWDDLPDFTYPSNMEDDWNSTKWGDSTFRSECPYVKDPNALIKTLLKRLRLMTGQCSNGEPWWNLAAVCKVLDQITYISQLIAVLTFNIACLDPQASEFLTHKIANGTCPRTVFRLFKDIWIVIQWVKGENIHHCESFIPMKLNTTLCQLWEVYYTLIHPAEKHLAMILWENSKSRLYMVYAWVWNGEVPKTPQFTCIFKATMEKFCSMKNCNICTFRHLNVVLGCVYLGSNFISKHFTVDYLTQQRSHSGSVECNHYGHSSSMLPTITTDSLQIYSNISDEWGNLVGFSPGSLFC
ncbi:hypothetical protein BDN71DRAFT_1428214 [Pleurotus eryngii]|uniref:Uncharacterized protein n=1 Tax=Pleurotus eryngii TaxID=5323 RepID=A0A9P6DJC5_PLEER|nr:hypothetical protein BDN71DRAFT_1428214 [Pleurotus eryngii]